MFASEITEEVTTLNQGKSTSCYLCIFKNIPQLSIPPFPCGFILLLRAMPGTPPHTAELKS